MLQWMGGSKRKVASSRKSVHNRQKHYFEQRKRQQHDPAHEKKFSAQKHSDYNGERRSLDIISLTNLENSISSRPIHEHDVSRIDPQLSRLFPEKVSTKVNSKCPEVYEETLSGLEPGPKSPIKVSADNIYRNKPNIAKHRTDSGRINVQPSPLPRASNNAKQPGKTEELQSDISILNLLADDGPSIILEEGQLPEAHVAFSVEGLGKVEFGTPAHSPLQHARIFPSPPNVQKKISSCEKFNYSQDYFGGEKDVTNIYYDDFSIDTMFKFSCTSPDACRTLNEPFNCKEDVFQVGHTGDNLSNGLGKVEFGMPAHSPLQHASRNFPSPPNVQKKISSCEKFSYSQDYFGGEKDVTNIYYDGFSTDTMFRFSCTSPDACGTQNEPFNCKEDVFQVGHTGDNLPNVMTPRYFRDLTSESEWSPDSYYQKRHHPYDKMTNPDSLFSPPRRFSSPLKDYQASEESSSFDSVTGNSSFAFGSKARKYSGRKIKHNYKHQMWSATNYDTEVGGTFHEQITATRKFSNLGTNWNHGSEYSKSHFKFDELGHEPMPEDDIFDSFHVGSKRSRASVKKFETGMSEVFPEDDIQLPDKFQWDAKNSSLQSPFDDDFDIKFPYPFETKGFPDDVEHEYEKITKTPERVDSIEKNSLSSNGRTSCIAGSKEKTKKSNVEAKEKSEELTETNHRGCSSDEVKDSPKNIPSYVPCTAENTNQDNRQGPVPSQVATKDPLHGNEDAGRENPGKSASYQVMLQLLYVQNILLQASQGKKRRSL